MAEAVDYLDPILARKRREVLRRSLHRHSSAALTPDDESAPALHGKASSESRGDLAIARLRRNGARVPRVIAEVKFRSPSAGVIRARAPGAAAAIAAAYERGGAAAISVLCDRPGFGGTPLDLRRAAGAVRAPLLFKEFVLDPLQVELARALGASMVLLIVRALDAAALSALVDEVVRQGMAPVVEAADADELEVALATRATIVGVNARDLRSFRVDPESARQVLARVPRDRVAVHMSGIASGADLAQLGDSRADAVLVGGGLMRAPDPGARLQEWLASAQAERGLR
jgi:indole-3-glycerol phosphate synthase